MRWGMCWFFIFQALRVKKTLSGGFLGTPDKGSLLMNSISRILVGLPGGVIQHIAAFVG